MFKRLEQPLSHSLGPPTCVLHLDILRHENFAPQGQRPPVPLVVLLLEDHKGILNYSSVSVRPRLGVLDKRKVWECQAFNQFDLIEKS